MADTVFFLLIFFGFVHALVCLIVANDKGRSGFWAIAGFFLGPIALLALVAVTNRKVVTQQQKQHTELLAAIARLSGEPAKPPAAVSNVSVTGATLKDI